MDNFHRLSNNAKQAWQRGYDLAHPRYMPARSRKKPKHGESAREAELARAVDTVGAALENLASSERKSFMAVKSGPGVSLVVMDPVSVEAVIVELDNMSTDECRKALGDGFLKGMIAKAKAANGGAQGSTPPTIN
ncbi:MAG: hypothetical protein IH786_09850 [Proteobacteria bacterium]|nr:hypothetical protein [Pseudomonadota bacterium]